MVGMDVSIDELTQSCGLTRAEAELMSKLHKNWLPVGASLLAMNVNDNAGILNKRVGRESIASRLAPTMVRSRSQNPGPPLPPVGAGLLAKAASKAQ
ncbi:hypothetical protein PMI34_04095 [Pseudomonas sp. GM74]|nr:hypothetical protein PMI34_04095 [Pseudomonas sp. GM74]